MSKKSVVRLTESDLNHIITESVKKALKEGTNPYTDGYLEYQGLDTDISKDRVGKIKKRNATAPLSMREIERMGKVFKYDGNHVENGDSRVSDLVDNLSLELDRCFSRFDRATKQYNLSDDFRFEINELRRRCNYLLSHLESKGLMKRDLAGEPLNNYKEK